MQWTMYLPSHWEYKQTSSCTWHPVHQAYEVRTGQRVDGVFTWQEQDGQEYKAAVDEHGGFVCYLSKPPFDGCKKRSPQPVRQPSPQYKIPYWKWH